MLGLHTGECGRRRAKLRFEWAVFSFTNVWYAKTKKGLAFVEIEFATRFTPLPGYDLLLPRYAFPEVPSVKGNRNQERSDARRDLLFFDADHLAPEHGVEVSVDVS